MAGGSGEALLQNGERLEVSRHRFRELLGALEGSARVLNEHGETNARIRISRAALMTLNSG
jgi:hypothetical protein